MGKPTGFAGLIARAEAYFPKNFNVKGLAAAFGYGLSSIILVFFNKIVLTNYGLHRTNFVKYQDDSNQERGL